VPGLGDDPMVQRAEIDAYNLGKPFPVLQWIADGAGVRPPTIEYRAFDSPKELLSAIGSGVQPLAHSVRLAAHPVVDIDRLPHPDPTRQQTRPRAFFVRSWNLQVDEMPRFFRYEDQVYLASPMQPIPGKPGDLGIYRLYGPSQLHRVCLFDAHMPLAHLPDHALSLPEITTLERAAGPLLPTGRLCASVDDQARALADHAAWRPWVLDRRHSMAGGSSREQLALYMRNRALTGPERARQYRAYIAARAAAIEALAPFYRDEFGRTAAEAKRFAVLYLDRKIFDGLELDPDDDTAADLFAADYADKHAAQQAALKGDTAALREALGPEPRAIAKGIKGDLDEPLVSDALEHPETLRAALELDLDPNEVGASGRTPLMVAARLDLVEAAAILLAHWAALDSRAKDAVAQTDSTGDPLCMTGEKAAGDTPGRTALSYAAELGSPEMVRLLLDHGADPASRDSAGRRPADYVTNRAGDAAQSARISEMLK
jgi:ankyrin repeat protein